MIFMSNKDNQQSGINTRIFYVSYTVKVLVTFKVIPTVDHVYGLSRGATISTFTVIFFLGVADLDLLRKWRIVMWFSII